MRALGLDIGGANVKGALVIHSTKGARIARQWNMPVELFRDKDGLAALLGELLQKAAPDAVALTMTGELCDCFTSRSVGARWIMRQTEAAAPNLELKVFNTTGEMVSINQAKLYPMSVASANWAVTLRWAAAHGLENGLVVDIGTTTTDILSVKNGAPSARGMDDFTRARAGELVYAGYLRTHASIAAPKIVVCGKEMDACPEYFAIVGDAHLLLGDIGAGGYTCPTPDGGPKTKVAAARRLCRMALSDLEGVGMDEAVNIARQVACAQATRLAEVAAGVAAREGLEKGADLLLVGSGASIYGATLRDRLGMRQVDRLGGIDASKINPALCAAMLGMVPGDL
ncbi:MAG: hypothetical protein OEZ04_05775 [Nitrospinota bacterium]|nr:hypothetical protein [Nitrospinota bacterium]